MPPWFSSIVTSAAPWWPYVIGVIAGIGSLGAAIKWYYDTSKARAEARDRAEKATEAQKLVKIPTLQELKEACEEFDAYERLRTEREQRIIGKTPYDRDNLDNLPKLSPLAEALAHDEELLQAARALRSGLPIPPLALFLVLTIAPVGILVGLDGLITGGLGANFEAIVGAIGAVVIVIVSISGHKWMK
jgi:Flp pilus assembly protein TadB